MPKEGERMENSLLVLIGLMLLADFFGGFWLATVIKSLDGALSRPKYQVNLWKRFLRDSSTRFYYLSLGSLVLISLCLGFFGAWTLLEMSCLFVMILSGAFLLNLRNFRFYYAYMYELRERADVDIAQKKVDSSRLPGNLSLMVLPQKI